MEATWNFFVVDSCGALLFLLVGKSRHHPVLVRCRLDLIVRCVVVVIESESSMD
jgi:hypothetical protein